METQNTANSQRNLEGVQKKNWAGGIRLPDLTIYYTTTLTKKYDTGTKTDKSMEQNRTPQNKPTHLQSIIL